MSYSADQLATIIKMACKKDVIDIGEDTDQDFYIFEWMNMFLLQNARKAYVTEFSDAIAISTTGYVDFQKNSASITDMLEPLMMFDQLNNDKQFAKRTSYDSTNSGWYRFDAYTQVHVRGASSTYKLNYLRYPAKITLGTQTPEYPPAGYQEMITWVCAQIKSVKNFYAESQAMLAQSSAVKLMATKASTYARGTNQGPPSPEDANTGG